MKCKRCRGEIPDGSRFCMLCGASQAAQQTPKARGNGTGSVFRRGRTWTAVRVLGYTVDDDGKLHK